MRNRFTSLVILAVLAVVPCSVNLAEAQCANGRCSPQARVQYRPTEKYRYPAMRSYRMLPNPFSRIPR